MFKSMKKSASKSDNKQVTSDQASTFSSAATLKADDASEYTLNPDDSQKKENPGFLTKLGAKKDGFLEKLEAGTPMGRSKALQKELKEAGDTNKGPRDNNPTYPLMHKECGKRELASVFPKQVDILLIDVRRMCLVKAVTNDRYLALSYAWGCVPQFNTTAANLATLLKQSSLEEVKSQLPNVIQDAIYLSKCLGELYLWVDSLCIVQDDPEIKHRQLALMAEIYNSATATIIACAGPDASAKLFHSEIVQALSKKELKRADAAYHSLPLIRKRRPLWEYKYEFETGIRRPLSTKSLMERIAKFHYSQRGWTCQERLLSRRRLYFLDDAVIFHCHLDCFTEEGEREVKTVADADLYGTLALASYQEEQDLKLLRAEKLAMKMHKGHGSEWPLEMVSTSWDLGFRFWSNNVREYSGKQFTFNTDVLEACTGILHAFEGYSHWPILEGMPEPVLDLALLWTPLTTVKRRLPTRPDDKPLRFPSWSWIGWKGEITFDLTGNEDHLEKLKSRISIFLKFSQGCHFQCENVKSRAMEINESPSTDHQYSFVNNPDGRVIRDGVAGVELYHPSKTGQRLEGRKGTRERWEHS